MYAKKLVLNNPPSPGENHFFHLDERLYGMLSSKLELAQNRMVERSTKEVNGV
jgi:hypothetical protein